MFERYGSKSCLSKNYWPSGQVEFIRRKVRQETGSCVRNHGRLKISQARGPSASGRQGPEKTRARAGNSGPSLGLKRRSLSALSVFDGQGKHLRPCHVFSDTGELDPSQVSGTVFKERKSVLRSDF